MTYNRISTAVGHSVEAKVKLAQALVVHQTMAKRKPTNRPLKFITNHLKFIAKI